MGVEEETKSVATEQGHSANGAQEEVSSGENLAVWVCGIDDLKMKPFKLPSTLGSLSLSLIISLSLSVPLSTSLFLNDSPCHNFLCFLCNVALSLMKRNFETDFSGWLFSSARL
jgi:hypothetical protein